MFFSFIFIVAGMALGFLSWRYFNNAKKSNAWTPVNALIIAKKISVARGGQGDVRQNKYHVTYQYSIAKETYTSNRISFRPGFIPVHKSKLKYDDITNTTAYYNPAMRSQAVLQRGVDASNYIAFIAAIFFLCVGIAYPFIS